MAEKDDNKAEASAEKAYAAASEAASDTPVEKTAEPEAKPAEPAKAAAKPAARKAAAKAPAKPAARAKAAPKAAKPRKAPAKPARKTPAAKPAASAKPVAAEKPAAAPAPQKKVEPAKSTAPALKSVTASKTPFNFTLKDTTMQMAPQFSENMSKVMTEAQSKAQEAFEKSSAMLGDYTEFAKGNVEAMVESGKIFAAGMQDMGTNLVAESRTAFETISSDVKEMASAKTPSDFMKIQSDIMKRNFDQAVAYSSANSEAMLKLVNETMAPISSRVSLAVEKVRTAA